MDTTLPTPTTARPRRAALVGAVLAATAALGVLGTAGPAAATDEFPAAPTATAEFACDTGPVVTLHLGNQQGLSAAHFDVLQTGKAPDGFDVATGSSSIVWIYGAPEDGLTTVSITGPNGFSYTNSWTVDCYDTDGAIVLSCDGDQPVITADLAQVGAGPDWVDLFGLSEGIVQGKAEGPSTTLTGTVPDGVPFHVYVHSQYDDEQVTSLDGTPHCTPDPTTTTTSTTPAPTTTSTTPTTTSTTAPPAVPAVTEPPRALADQVTPVPTPAVAPQELARTGATTLPLALTGLTLVAVGIALRRYALRRA